MKRSVTAAALLLSLFVKAQDGLGTVEPRESSYENKDLILLALAAFGVLMAIYFLFKRNRRRHRR
jgi:hypothetical protein